MLQNRGLTVEVTGGPGDEGVDIIARDITPITGGMYLVQCKRYALDRKVGVADVRELYGTVQEKRASKGVLVTSSTFTTQARRFAEDKPLELIDGTELQELLESIEQEPDYERLWDDIEDYIKENAEVPDDSEGDQSKEDRLEVASLHEAAADDNLTGVRILLDKGADINELDSEQFTPLQKAVMNDAGLAMLELLLDRGADIDARGVEGYAALHMAIMKGNRRSVTLLINKGAHIEAQNDNDWLTPLHIAIAQGNLSIVALLLGSGADPNLTNADGITALHGAVKMNPLAIPLLIQHGADTESQDDSHVTPLLLAVAEERVESIRLLIDGGAHVDGRGGDDDSITPLHMAISPDTDPSILPLLLDFGADIEARGRRGDDAPAACSRTGDAIHCGNTIDARGRPSSTQRPWADCL